MNLHLFFSNQMKKIQRQTVQRAKFFVAGTRPGGLPEANSIRPAQLSVREDTPPRVERIGARGGPNRGPRPATPHHQIGHQRLSTLNLDASSSSSCSSNSPEQLKLGLSIGREMAHEASIQRLSESD